MTRLKLVSCSELRRWLNTKDLSHIMRKSVYAICEQQRHRSDCADQRLCCSLPREPDISSFYIGNFKTLDSFFSWDGRFESYLVKNPKTGFLVTRLILSLSSVSKDTKAECYNTVINEPLRDKTNKYEPRHDKTNRVSVRPAKTQISLGIR